MSVAGALEKGYVSQCEQMRDSMLLLYTDMGAFIEEYPWKCYKWSGS